MAAGKGCMSTGRVSNEQARQSGQLAGNLKSASNKVDVRQLSQQVHCQE